MRRAGGRPASDSPADPARDASARIDVKIASLADWRGETLRRMRALIRAADAAVVEEVKWGDVPVWSKDGIVCTGETYKQVVKLTFAHGAALADPAGLFNASLDGQVRRAIDLREGGTIDAAAFQALVLEAIRFNAGRAPTRRRPAK